MAMLMDGGHIGGTPMPQLRARLVLSNEETDAILWLTRELPRIAKWDELSKAPFKRMMAGPYWAAMEMLYRADPANARQMVAFSERVAALREEGVAPLPMVTGETLIRLGVTPGPTFKRWLNELYDRQLEGELQTAEEAMAAAKALIRSTI